MVTFLDVAHMVDATAMMGVLGWGGGDGNVPWRCTHGRCYGKEEKYGKVDATARKNMLETMILMMMMMMMMTNDHDDDDDP